MLLLRCGNSVLLQKRPSKAIWGGLWSLPEGPWVPKTSMSRVAEIGLQELFAATLPNEKASALTKACKSLMQAEEIKHIFTHRRLWMQIWQTSSAKELTFLNPDLKWVPLSQLGRYGLPQPIKILLQGLSLVRGDDLKNSAVSS
jgi:A/G-specific adenine glycosylase